MILNKLIHIIFLLGVMTQTAKSESVSESLPNNDNAIFTIKKVKGLNLVQLPLSGEWMSAKSGMKLPSDTLLQVTPTASITLDALGSLGRTGVPISSSTININKSMIIRLNVHSFRRIQMDAKLIAALPDSNSLKIMQKHLKAFDAMIDAWRQDATMLAGKDWINDDVFRQLAEATAGNMEKDAVSVTGKIGKINLYTPKDLQNIWAKELPVNINMNWSLSDNSGKNPTHFKVYLWKKGQGRQVFAQITGNRFSASLSEEGKYFVQIESTDGGYKSELRSIDIKRRNLRPGTIDDQVNPGVVEQNQALTDVINNRTKLQSPPAEFRWHSERAWPIMEFKWTRPASAAGSCHYKFYVNNSKRALIFSLETVLETVQWHPDVSQTGMFTWQVETLSCNDHKGEPLKLGTKSNMRRFFLLKPERLRTAMAPYDKASTRGFVYLDL
jgi:hypothetical protein